MDLIYADKNRIELGAIKDCEFDCAFGVDENDFECAVDMDHHVCMEDYFIYFDQTQYGGIIDKIKVSTEDHTITYTGRTWHGILNTRVLSPPSGYDYLTLTGEANTVIAQIIDIIGLGDIFTVSTEDSGLYIPGFQVRYAYAYDTILAMLRQVNGKMMLSHVNGFVQLSIHNIADYSNNEEFDSSQVGFNAEKTFNTYNHFICLGGGNLKDRFVIHLFTNENGEVQPYTKIENPISDADYILDESKKVMYGLEERVFVYDLSGAQTTENYVPLQSVPVNWKHRYTEFYVYDADNEGYKILEREYADQYILTKVKPSDWVSNYEEFYYKSGSTYKCISDLISGKVYEILTEKPATWNTDYKNYYKKVNGAYEKVSLIEAVSYKQLKKQPNDWKKNYGSYFYFFTDGVDSEYREIEGKQKIYYVVQNRQPTDWKDGYDEYFELNAKGKYVKIEIKDYKRLKKQPGDWSKKYANYFYYYSDGTKGEYRAISGTSEDKYTLQSEFPTDWHSNYGNYYFKSGSQYYKVEGVPLTGSDEKVSPIWKPSKYYTKSSVTKAPDYNSFAGVYRKADPPKWKKKRYYTQEKKTVTPSFRVHPKVFKKITTTSIPAWAANTYYDESETNDLAWEKNKYYRLKKDQEIIPEFAAGKYYQKRYDHYADLVDNAIKKIQEIYDCDSIDTNLSLEDDYDIGDIVGATELVTGISVWQPITKKIVKIKGSEQTIEYEVGGK